MHRPRVRLEGPLDCIGWAMALASATAEPFTLRDVKRLPPEPYPDLDWLRTVASLEDDGDLRTFKTREGRRGRPTIFYYPAHRVAVALDDEGMLNTLDTGEPVKPPNLRELVEIDGTSVPTESEQEAEQPEAEPALQASSPEPPEPEPTPPPCEHCGGGQHNGELGPYCPDPKCESNIAPEPDTFPQAQAPPCEYCGEELDVYTRADEYGKAKVDMACVNRECPGPDGKAATESEPAPTLEVGSGRDDERDKAYELMRNLIRKSVKEREGIGCTAKELRWLLERKGYSEDDALAYVRDLAGRRAEGWYVDGLRLEGPLSVRNKTEEPRYYLRTEAQSLEPHMAEYEAEKLRQHFLKKEQG